MKRRDFLLKSTFAAAMAATTGPRLLNVLADTENSLTLISKTVTPTIVIAPDATASEQFAAQELATYLNKMSEKQIPVITNAAIPQVAAGTPLIILGHHPQNADLHPEKMDIEESVIDVSADRLRIVGGPLPPVNKKDYVRDPGTLYGVYNFLDQLGVRWYRPEPWGEHVPQLATISLPYGKSTFTPVYKYRYGISTYRHSRDQTPEQQAMILLWATRNRQNADVFHTPAGYGGYLQINFAGAYQYLVPAGRYFAEHPDYFALIDGKRNAHGQLDLGNPAVQDLVANEIISQAQRYYPQRSIFSIGPNDGNLWGTEADSVALDDPHLISVTSGKVSMSNRVAAFGNIIAERLAKAVPGAKVGWLAYNMQTEVPTLVKSMHPNTSVQAAAYTAAYSDYSKDLDDPTSAPNARFLKVLQGWSKLTELTTYEYWSGYAWYGPLPIVHTMVDRLRKYRDLEVKGVYLESHPSWGPQGLGLYMYTKLLWNPDIDVQKELDAYYTNYYGPAAEQMKAYHELIETASQKGPLFVSGGHMLEKLFTVPLVTQMGQYMDKARALVKGQEPYEQRLEGVWAGYEVARLMSVFTLNKQQQKPQAAMDAMNQLKAFILSYSAGDVFDNGPVIFRSIFGFMSMSSKGLEAQVALLQDYQDVQVNRNLDNDWRFGTDPQNDGLQRGVTEPAFSDVSWGKINATGWWQGQGYSGYKGTGWYRKSFAAPKLEKNQQLLLFFGAVDGDAIVYLNGKKVGEHILGQRGEGWDKPFLLEITNAIQPGANVIAVQVSKPSKLIGPVGITQGVSLLTGVPK
jgi:hypothetical protein